MNWTASIKKLARELGFDLVGITTADPPPHVAEFRQWLADGFHGTMGYLPRTANRRADPQLVLPGAKSIIVVGLNYNCGPTRLIARYAAGRRDYHAVMGEKLAALAAPVNGKWYVDTGPVLERDLAQRAGLGWIGKHTNLIHPRIGNWFFLGAVLTARELTPDEPARPHCGTCTRCLAACPTGAIVAPYRLDARRCISYLTIELKGSIPVELRPLIGDHLFGCDDCLAVCPWNRWAQPVFAPRAVPPLPAMLDWTEQDFANWAGDTPIARLGRGRWLRNVCVVLGNTGDPAVARALDDPDPLVREHAAWAVAHLRTSRRESPTLSSATP